MLMLGESVFSILIVGYVVAGDSKAFFATFYCSVLTVVLLQFLHFRSQPAHANQHATRRDKNAGVTWSILQYVYSLALVGLGAAFTFFLESFAYTRYPLALQDEPDSRWLAGDTGADSAAGLGNATYLFSGSLAVIFFSLDIMTVLHLGRNEAKGRCVCARTKKKNKKGIALIACRVALLIFTATSGVWEKRPEYLVVIGLLCVLLQLSLRKIGGWYLGKNLVDAHASSSRVDDSQTGDAQWPNVTHARARPNADAAG